MRFYILIPFDQMRPVSNTSHQGFQSVKMFVQMCRESHLCIVKIISW